MIIFGHDADDRSSLEGSPPCALASLECRFVGFLPPVVQMKAALVERFPEPKQPISRLQHGSQILGHNLPSLRCEKPSRSSGLLTSTLACGSDSTAEDVWGKRKHDPHSRNKFDLGCVAIQILSASIKRWVAWAKSAQVKPILEIFRTRKVSYFFVRDLRIHSENTFKQKIKNLSLKSVSESQRSHLFWSFHAFATHENLLRWIPRFVALPTRTKKAFESQIGQWDQFAGWKLVPKNANTPRTKTTRDVRSREIVQLCGRNAKHNIFENL